MLFSAALYWAVDEEDEPDDTPTSADVDGDTGITFKSAIWLAWTFLVDPGTHAKEVNAKQRVVSAFITILGIFYFAMILGIVVDAIREKMDSLKRGKSRVVEQNHTLALSWTDKSILLIEEIAIANESENGGVVVLLAEQDKEKMEMELQMQNIDLRGTRVVFRSGSPLLFQDLVKVKHAARARGGEREGSFQHLSERRPRPTVVYQCTRYRKCCFGRFLQTKRHQL